MKLQATISDIQAKLQVKDVEKQVVVD